MANELLVRSCHLNLAICLLGGIPIVLITLHVVMYTLVLVDDRLILIFLAISILPLYLISICKLFLKKLDPATEVAPAVPEQVMAPVQRRQQDVEAIVEDNPPDYEDVISKAPPYEIIVMEDMRRFPGMATVSVLPPERAPLTPHGHGGYSGTGAVDENIDPELPTYQEAVVGISGEIKL